MIIEELFEINGVQHVRRYSNSGVKIASNDRVASERRTGTIQELSETLIVGGDYVNGTPTAQWKGTMHMFKVFKQALNTNEIIDLLGIEDIYNSY